MNIDLIRNEINKHLNERVIVNVFALRNKSYRIKGYIKKTYPKLFVVDTDNEEKILSYADVATGEVKITYM